MKKKKSSPTQTAFALLVGVDDYRAYDRSKGNPAGTSDLRAGGNDVLAFYRTCRRLGIPKENIHVLTSPKVPLSKLGEPGENARARKDGIGYLGKATGAEIRAELAWLGKKLARASKGGEAPAGLFTYSGHGDFHGASLALCPSDVRAGAGGDLEGAIGFDEIAAILGARAGASENLTVVLDCCHAGAAAAKGPWGGRSGGTSLTGRSPPADLSPTSLGARMLMAAKAGEVAYQSTFDERHHGALTWASAVVLEQWTIASEHAGSYVTITHGELRSRAQRLLDALSFGQTVTLLPEAAADTNFFHRGARDAGDVVSKEPNAGRHPIQLDPNTRDYTIYRLDVTLVFAEGPNTLQAFAMSVNRDSPSDAGYGPFLAGTEYWWMSTVGPFLSRAALVQKVVFTRLNGIDGQPGEDWARTPSSGPLGGQIVASQPTALASPRWERTDALPSPTHTVFSGAHGITLNAEGAPTWWAAGEAPSSYIVKGSRMTFDADLAQAGASTSWYTPQR